MQKVRVAGGAPEMIWDQGLVQGVSPSRASLIVTLASPKPFLCDSFVGTELWPSQKANITVFFVKSKSLLILELLLLRPLQASA